MKLIAAHSWVLLMLAVACSGVGPAPRVRGTSAPLTTTALDLGGTAQGQPLASLRHALACGADDCGLLWMRERKVLFSRLTQEGARSSEPDTVMAWPADAEWFEILPELSHYRAVWADADHHLHTQTLSTQGAALGEIVDLPLSVRQDTETAPAAVAGKDGLTLVVGCADDGSVQAARVSANTGVLDALPLTLGLACTSGTVRAEYVGSGFVVFATEESEGSAEEHPVKLRAMSVSEEGVAGEAELLADTVVRLEADADLQSASNGTLALVALEHLTNSELWVMRVDAAGAPLDAAPSKFADSPYFAPLASSGGGFMLARESSLHTGVLRFDAQGHALAADFAPPKLALEIDFGAPDRLFAVEGGYLLTLGSWSDIGLIHFAVRLDESDEPAELHPFTAVPAEQDVPDVAWNGKEFLAVWADNRDGYQAMTLRGKRVQRDGSTSDDSYELLRLSDLYVWNLSLSSNGAGYLLAYETKGILKARAPQVFYARLDAHGTPIGTPTAMSHAVLTTRPASAAGDGVYLLVWWQLENDQTSSLRGMLIDASGHAQPSFVIDAPDSEKTARNANDRPVPAVVWSGTQFLVGWSATRMGVTDLETRVRVASVSRDGKVTGASELPALERYETTIALGCSREVCLAVCNDYTNSTLRYYAFPASEPPAESLWSGIWAERGMATIAPLPGGGFSLIAAGTSSDLEQIQRVRLSLAGELSEPEDLGSLINWFGRLRTASAGEDSLLVYAVSQGFTKDLDRSLSHVAAVLFHDDAPPGSLSDAGADAGLVAPTQDGGVASDAGVVSDDKDAGQLVDEDEDAATASGESDAGTSGEPAAKPRTHHASGCSVGVAERPSYALLWLALALIMRRHALQTRAIVRTNRDPRRASAG